MASIPEVLHSIITKISPLFHSEADLVELREQVEELKTHLVDDIKTLVGEAIADFKKDVGGVSVVTEEIPAIRRSSDV